MTVLLRDQLELLHLPQFHSLHIHNVYLPIFILTLTNFICTSTNFSDLEGSISFEGSFFSTPNTTPSLVLIPIAVDPNFNQVLINRKWGNITYLNSFNCILNLIDSAFRRKCVNTTIVVLFTMWDIKTKRYFTFPSTFLRFYILKIMVN